MFRGPLLFAVLAALAYVRADVLISPQGHSDLCLAGGSSEGRAISIAKCSAPHVLWAYLPRTDSSGPLIVEGTENSDGNSLAVLPSDTAGTYTPELEWWNGRNASEQAEWLWHWTEDNQLQYAPDTGLPPDQKNATHYCLKYDLSGNTVQMDLCGSASDQVWSYANYSAPSTYRSYASATALPSTSMN